MRWGALRPVGEPLAPIRRDIRPADLLPAGFQGVFVQSGTAALALALLTIKAGAPASRRRVVLPAYGCPDLVAATVYAGLEPYLVDTAPDSPFYDQEALAREIDDQVLAVVCVHFLGLREQTAEVAAIASEVGAAIIEDSAQAIPPCHGAGLADLVVVSFGRGKPLGALGGGLLLVREGSRFTIDSALVDVQGGEPLSIGLRRAAYNLAIRPAPYRLLAGLRFLKIGLTEYQALSGIELLSQARTCAALSQWAVASQLANVWQTNAQAIAAEIYRDLAAGGWRFVQPATVDFPAVVRLPILAPDRPARDKAHRAFQSAGHGSSMMYGRALPELGCPEGLKFASIPNALRFADLVLTLPVHSGVQRERLARYRGCFIP